MIGPVSFKDVIVPSVLPHSILFCQLRLHLVDIISRHVVRGGFEFSYGGGLCIEERSQCNRHDVIAVGELPFYRMCWISGEKTWQARIYDT